MKLFGVVTILGFMSMTLIVGAETAYAVSWNGYSDLQSRLDGVHERIEAHMMRVEERLRQARDRIKSDQQRICDRFSSRSYLIPPSFCDAEPEPEEPTLDFSALPTEITEGATSTLLWDSENTNSCEASGGWSGTKDVDGLMEVSPSTTTVYTLTCSGAGGDVDDSVTVIVHEEQQVPDAPTLNLSAFPLIVLVDATSTLAWDSEHATSCEASDGWSGSRSLDGDEVVDVSATTTYTLTCTGEGGTTTKSVTVNVFEVNVPTVDHVLISEVLYDLVSGGAQGIETGGANEWVELYNPTDTAVDLMDWMLGESTSTADTLSTLSLMLLPGEYVVVTNATTTADFWDFTLVDVIYLGSAIGNGLANGGDHVALFDASESTVDDVSYGADETAFSPSVSGVTAGNSIARIPVAHDTDTAADWIESDSPTPGS